LEGHAWQNMTQEMAKEITMRAHNTGMAVVGVWMLEIAEGYSTILNENGLKSDIEED
jgi:ATP-dependent Clp protease adapter protein ClpS